MGHSKLGASSAYRWINCPGSVALIEKSPAESSSPHATEGTQAHDLAEIILLNKAWCKADYPEDMEDAVMVYVDYIRNNLTSDTKLQIETEFDLSFIYAGMFGTNDACLISPHKKHLEIIDYKHGSGLAVEVKENTQLLYYALGAVAQLCDKQYSLVDGGITLTIVQPRAYHPEGAIRSWHIDLPYLLAWGEQLKEYALATVQESAPVQLGDWCRFCTAKAICPAMRAKSMEVAKSAFDDDMHLVLPKPQSLSGQEIETVLDHASMIGKWVTAVKKYALDVSGTGATIPGYKLVQKLSDRQWGDAQETAKDLLLEGFTEEQIFTPKSIKSPAQLEKAGVKKDLVNRYCERLNAGISLVPVSDRRAEIEGSKLIITKDN